MYFPKTVLNSPKHLNYVPWLIEKISQELWVLLKKTKSRQYSQSLFPNQREKAPAGKTPPLGTWSTCNAASKFWLGGWYRLHGVSGTWFWLCQPCQTKDMFRLPGQNDHHLFLSPSPQPWTWHQTITYPSGCCKLFLMVLISWKWPDMSVDNTISITKFRSSLQRHQKENSSFDSSLTWSGTFPQISRVTL